MPILDARHDLAHPVETDTAWSESDYFNAYDPDTDSGLFSRIGIRPNEGRWMFRCRSGCQAGSWAPTTR